MYSQCPDCQTRFRVTAEVLRAARGTVRCGRCGSAFDALERLSDTIPPPGPAALPLALLAAPDGDTAAAPPAGDEYHFSAEDLERVFVETGGWREAPAPESALLATLEPAATGDEPPVVVDENAGVEDITLEGERISIVAPPDADAEESEIDLDATNELEILRDVPDSAFPEDEEAAEREIEALARALQEEPVPSQAAAVQPAEPAVAPGPLEAIEPPAMAATSPPAGRAAMAPEPAAVARSSLEPPPLAPQRWQRPVEEPEPEPEPEPAPGGSAWGALGWTLGAFVLAVALAAQVIHHFRQDLVRHPQIGPALRATYERLGVELLPRWDLAAFELRQWGNDADAAAQGRMVVRASLTNRAGFAQPHPILRLELEDRFGATVAMRDFEPADYLKNPSQATRLVGPGASSEAELLLADPGPEAVGYRLDVCLRESASRLRCARGPG